MVDAADFTIILAQAASTLLEKSGDKANKTCHMLFHYEPEYSIALIMEVVK